MRLSDVKAVETLFDCVQLMDKDAAKEANNELMRIIRLSLTVCQTRPELQRLGKLIARAQLFAIRENFTRDEITAALLPESTQSA